MSQASLLEDRNFHANILQTDTHHNILSQSQWSPLGRKLISKEGCLCLNAYWIYLQFALLLQGEIFMHYLNNIK